MEPCQPRARIGLFLSLLIASLAHAGIAAEPSIACKTILDPEHILVRNDVVLLGEMHGTAEIPDFLATAVCRALQRGRSVTVGLEIPREENARLQSYLASPGGKDDLAALLAGPFWQSPLKDGRSSQAMRDLVERLRNWRAAGLPVHVLPLDPVEFPMPANGTGPSLVRAEPAAHEPSGTRDRAMAESLAVAIRQAPDEMSFLVLTGNVHNRLRPGTPWDPHLEPMGYLLARSLRSLGIEKHLAALDVHYPGGKASFCSGSLDAPSCKPTELPDTSKGAHPQSAEPGLVSQATTDQSPYSGYFYFPANLTPSSPAVAPPDAPAIPAGSQPSGPP